MTPRISSIVIIFAILSPLAYGLALNSNQRHTKRFFPLDRKKFYHRDLENRGLLTRGHPSSDSASLPGAAARLPHGRPGGFRRENGLSALKLNQDHRALDDSDDCNEYQIACIYNGLARCIDGKWDITPCPSDTTCMVLPLLESWGTETMCATESEARGRFHACGLNGDSGKPQGQSNEPAGPSGGDSTPSRPPRHYKRQLTTLKYTVTVTVTDSPTPRPSTTRPPALLSFTAGPNPEPTPADNPGASTDDGGVPFGPVD